MSDTPRTDSAERMAFNNEYIVPTEFARELERELAEVRRDRDTWKANHDNQVTINRALRDRPDLGERAKLVAGLIQQRDTLAEAAQAVVDRWEAPTWKELEPTARLISALRKAIATVKGGSDD